MHLLPALVLTLCLLQTIRTSPVSQSNQCPSTASPLAQNINEFGFELTSRLNRVGNLFISPFSVYTAIAMAYAGSRGRTAKQIEQALKLQTDGLTGFDLQHSFKNLLDNYVSKQNSGNGNSVETANGLFLQKDFSVKEEYVHDLKTFYQAVVKLVDFAGNGEAARNEINRWVSDSTHNKIEQMLSEPLSSMTRLALLNAIYFKGIWKVQFDKEDTFDGTFYKSADERKQVKLMSILKQNYFFYEDFESGYQFLEMPYKGEDLVMLLALPRTAQDYPDLTMSSSRLCDIFGKLNNVTMDAVTIPKFSLQYEKQLKDALVAAGVQDLFTSAANLTGISDEGNLAVSSVLHKAVIDVNEEGSEAAATTGVFITKLALFPTNDFIANHPFLFYIVDKRNMLVLFSGRVDDP